MSEQSIRNDQTWKPDSFGEIVEHVRREGLSGISGIFSRKSWRVELKDRLTIYRRHTKATAMYSTIRGISLQGKIPYYPELVIEFTRREPIALFGLRKDRALALIEAINEQRAIALIERISDHLKPIKKWFSSFQTELGSDRWFSRDTYHDLLEAKPRPDQLTADLTLILQSPRREKILKRLSKINRQLLCFWEKEGYRDEIDQHNARFSEKELERYSDYFDAIERSPLTDEQRQAVVCFDNRVLVVAAAGSGKTSTMVAKAGYAVQREIVKPEEILMLAFNKPAAAELDQRVKRRLKKHGIPVKDIRGSTFHALGLDIIGQATGRKPRVARFIDQKEEKSTALQILQAAARQSDSIMAKITLLRYVFSEDLADFNDEEQDFDAWDGKTQSQGFWTLKGEVVKSQEERVIADWLYVHGINYQYETPYEIDVADAMHSQYHPDFYYPDTGLYHEHFALDADGNPPPLEGFSGYMDSVIWKRELHAEHKTKLVETTSAGIRTGDDLQRLLEVLEEHGLKREVQEDIASKEREPIKEAKLAETLLTFLSHVKSNRLTMADLRSRLAEESPLGSSFRHRLFLDVFEEVWKGWQKALNEEQAVDFDDMLNEATDLVRAGRFASPYRLVLADEFQDVSHARASLLQALTKPPHHFLFAVGDDWQSIYRFAGADVRAMTEFHQMYGEGPTSRLQQTFRCPQSLAEVAARFVMENPTQIQKSVYSAVTEPEGGSIRGIVYEEVENMDIVLEQSIKKLHAKVCNGPRRAESRTALCILGRYWHNKPKDLHTWQERYPGLEISFSTIHKAKGLEADYVFIAPMNAGRWGFPSTIEDDPVLQLAMPHADKFPFAEERRLFYVALTRARVTVTLFAPRFKRSRFFNTLAEWGMPVFDHCGARIQADVCDICGQGNMVRRDGRYGPFYGCSQFPKCRNTRKVPQPSSREESQYRRPD